MLNSTCPNTYSKPENRMLADFVRAYVAAMVFLVFIVGMFSFCVDLVAAAEAAPPSCTGHLHKRGYIGVLPEFDC